MEFQILESEFIMTFGLMGFSHLPLNDESIFLNICFRMHYE